MGCTHSCFRATPGRCDAGRKVKTGGPRRHFDEKEAVKGLKKGVQPPGVGVRLKSPRRTDIHALPPTRVAAAAMVNLGLRGRGIRTPPRQWW